MKKLFMLIGAVLTLGLAAACGNGAKTSPSFPVTTLGPTLAPIETPMTTSTPMSSESPMTSGSPASSATP